MTHYLFIPPKTPKNLNKHQKTTKKQQKPKNPKYKTTKQKTPKNNKKTTKTPNAKRPNKNHQKNTLSWISPALLIGAFGGKLLAKLRLVLAKGKNRFLGEMFFFVKKRCFFCRVFLGGVSKNCIEKRKGWREYGAWGARQMTVSKVIFPMKYLGTFSPNTLPLSHF